MIRLTIGVLVLIWLGTPVHAAAQTFDERGVCTVHESVEHCDPAPERIRLEVVDPPPPPSGPIVGFAWVDIDMLTVLAGVRGATQLVAGRLHVCALTPDGVVCWGTSNSRIPSTLGEVASITATGDRTCATQVDGEQRCWGREGDAFEPTHQCAVVDGGDVACWIDDPGAPVVTVEGLGDITTMVSGDRFSCALLATGRVRCWEVGRAHRSYP